MTDYLGEETETDHLIAADIMVKLLTEIVVELDFDLTAVESKVGWTVVGKQNLSRKDSYMTLLLMHTKNIPLNELRELDVLVILNSTVITKENDNLCNYSEKMKILSDA